MRILVAGIGALGSNLVRSLIPDLKGEHKITILDKDKVEERNITAGTQAYTRDQIGIPKVEALQFNIYKWYDREIEIFNNDIRKFLVGRPGQDLIIDCFDNSEARAILQRNYLDFVPLLHLGFSNNYTFTIEWAENYKTPSDLTSGFDICTLPGAAAFVSSVAALGSLVAEEFILHGKKLEITGGKYIHSLIK